MKTSLEARLLRLESLVRTQNQFAVFADHGELQHYVSRVPEWERASVLIVSGVPQSTEPTYVESR